MVVALAAALYCTAALWGTADDSGFIGGLHVNATTIPERLIAVDWGTTNFRAWLLNAGGEVLDQIHAPRGVAHIAGDEFIADFHALLAPWLRALPQAPVVMAGMVGSADGMQEVPYLPCPVGIDAIAANLARVPGVDDKRRVFIVPGLSARSLGGNYDVMRGEEVQIVGARAQAGDDPARLYCIPGTHSKWVSLTHQRVTALTTSLTGDAYTAMREHTFLARSMAPGEHDAAAFRRGLSRAGHAGGLLHHLFSVRTEALQGRLLPSAAASYLSGVLIGDEVNAMLAAHGDCGAVSVIGGQPLLALYRDAMRFHGCQVHCLDGEHMARRGLYELVRRAADTGLLI